MAAEVQDVLEVEENAGFNVGDAVLDGGQQEFAYVLLPHRQVVNETLDSACMSMGGCTRGTEGTHTAYEEGALEFLPYLRIGVREHDRNSMAAYTNLGSGVVGPVGFGRIDHEAANHPPIEAMRSTQGFAELVPRVLQWHPGVGHVLGVG